MDKQAFKQRMQNLKSYRENNPGKGYWDWRNSLPDNLKYTDDTEYDMVGAYNSGAQPTLEDDGSYHLPTRVPSTGKVLKSSIHPTYWKGLAEDEKLGYHTYWLPDGSTYTASKYDVPIQAYQNGGRHALGVGQVFASLADMLFNKERRTPAIAAAAYHTIHQTQNDLALAPVEAPLIEPIVDAVKSVDETPYDPGEVFLLSPENQKKQITKNPNYRVVDTNSEEDPYRIVRRAANYHKEIHGEVPVYDYIADSDTTIKRSNLMPVGTLPIGDYTPKLPHAGSYNSVLYYNAGNDKLYQRAYDLNDYGPTDTKDKGASSMYIGPVRWLSRQLDKAGTPFVQRTGFVPFDEEKYYNQLPESARKKVSEWRRLRNSYEYGGEVDEFQRKTRRDIMQESLVDGRPDYNKMFQNQNEYQKDFANYWYTERAKNPKYSDQIGGDKLNSVLSNIDKATWKTPTEAMRDNMVGQGYNPTDAQINQQLNILKEKGTKGFANPKAHSYTSLRPANTWHEGVGHMVGDNTPAILNATPNVRISNPDSSYEDYVNQANEKHAQTWDFRGNNSNLKDDQGNYYIDPNRQLTPEDISNMRSKGAKIPEQWESLEDADISELTNTFAYNLSQDPIYYMANGGEVGDPDDEFTKAINTKLGRTPDGRPLQQGLKPVFDLEDAANLTPVGDAIAAKDMYNAAMDRDWTGLGLAAASMIPFMPMTVKQFRKKYKGVTPKPTYSSDSKLMDKKIQDRINEFEIEKARREAIINNSKTLPTKANNEGYNIVEALMDDPSYLARAAEVKNKFGDNYARIYADIIQDYNINPNRLPKSIIDLNLDPEVRAQMRANKTAQETVNKGGRKPDRGDFELAINPENTDLSGNVTLHEWNHYTDYIKNKSPKADANSPMFYQMSKDMDGVRVDDNDSYFSLPTEQKAYMNQLREYLFNTRKINRRGDKVSQSLIKDSLKELEKIDNYKSVVRASKQFKSLRGYTKWFNSIPLLGAGAIGVNKYFNNGTEQEK